MDSVLVRAVIAGALFGAWPLFMSKSGLAGNVGTLIFSIVVVLSVIPFAWHTLATAPNSFAQANWTMTIAAGVFGGIGVLVFNSMLASSTPQNVGTYFVIALLVQVALPAIYSIVMNGGVTMTKAAGFVLAAAAGVLLSRT
jgi:hypothetical protein